MNNHMFTDVDYIDMAKAFDKVSHTKLLYNIYIMLVFVGMCIHGLNHISKIGYKEIRLMINIVILLI